MPERQAMTTDISICNTSLIMVGADDITSFSDNTVEAKLANSVYKDTKKTLLQYYPWRFSLRQVDLGGALSSPPDFSWNYQYQLPSDCLRIIQLENAQEYELYGRQIYTNVKPARVIYQRNVSEADMPSYFIRALNFHLARLFAMSLQEDGGKMNVFDRAADKETARARQLDAQQQPTQRIPDIAFTALNSRG